MRRIKYYLAGPICDVKDNSYIHWRKDLRDFLESLGAEALDPTDKYQGHVGDVKNELEKMRVEGEWDYVKDFMEKFVLPSDRLLVRKSKGVIAYIPKSVGYSVGTLREISLAYEWNKPVYIVTDIKVPSNSLIGMATKIFRNFDELKLYLKQNNGKL